MVASGELTSLGKNLANALNALSQRTVVVVSADLAHTHLSSGPYGFSKDAEPFDQACGAWARTLDSDVLLQTALKHAVNAESCGYTGLVVLDGLMSEMSAQKKELDTRGQVPLKPLQLRGSSVVSDTPKWNASAVVGPFHPTYYGMMTAFFQLE